MKFVEIFFICSFFVSMRFYVYNNINKRPVRESKKINIDFEHDGSANIFTYKDENISVDANPVTKQVTPH